VHTANDSWESAVVAVTWRGGAMAVASRIPAAPPAKATNHGEQAGDRIMKRHLG
jgi:hypothetical protein